jgi:hypothetical protein
MKTGRMMRSGTQKLFLPPLGYIFFLFFYICLLFFLFLIFFLFRMDKFSSDRSIIEYSEKIWGIRPCIVPDPLKREEAKVVFFFHVLLI